MAETTKTTSTSQARGVVDNGREAVGEARTGLAETMDAMRVKAEEVGERLPEVVEAVRAGAADGARTVQSWPEPTQKLVAAFSLGLGIGLTLTGAPRLAVAATLAPAIIVAANILGREGERPRVRVS